MAATYKDNGGSVNGSNKVFTYDFPVLKTEDIKVALNGVTQATTKYTASLSPATITFNNTSIDATLQNNDGTASQGAPLAGVTVRVYRETTVGKTDGNEDPKAVFAAGSSIRAGDLNANTEQALFGIHELQDRPIISEDISDTAVTTAKIANDAVTADKLANSINTNIATNTSQIQDIISAGAVAENLIVTLSESVDGSRTDFTMSSTPATAQNLMVSVNGVIQKPNTGTTISGSGEGFCVSGNTLKFATAPANGSSIFVVVQTAASGGTSTLSFIDGAKVQFGTGNDLEIYHDGSNSYINENGTGNLHIRSTSLVLETETGSDAAGVAGEQIVWKTPSGAVTSKIDVVTAGSGGDDGHGGEMRFFTKRDGSDETPEVLNLTPDSLTLKRTIGPGGTALTDAADVVSHDLVWVTPSGLNHGIGKINVVTAGSGGDNGRGGEMRFYAKRNNLSVPPEVLNLTPDSLTLKRTTTDGGNLTDAAGVVGHDITWKTPSGLTNGIAKIDVITTGSGGENGHGADIRFYAKPDNQASPIEALRINSDGPLIPDNKKLQIGAGGDLNLYHDGSNSYISDTGTGDLKFLVGTETKFELGTNGVKAIGIDGLTIQGPADNTADLFFNADNGDDAPDKWYIGAQTDGSFRIMDYVSNTWTDCIKIDNDAGVYLKYKGVNKFQTSLEGVATYGQTWIQNDASTQALSLIHISEPTRPY